MCADSRMAQPFAMILNRKEVVTLQSLGSIVNLFHRFSGVYVKAGLWTRGLGCGLSFGLSCLMLPDVTVV